MIDREDALYAETLGVLKFMREWDYIVNCQRDMFDPRFMPPFRDAMDAERAVAPSPLRPDILREESNGYSGN
jgi:hypothetical protein